MTGTSTTRIIGFASAVSLLNVAVLSLFGVLVHQALDSVAVNTHRIEVNAHQACTDLNRGFTRSNKTIDSAIEAEARKPAPDAKRLKDLRNFRLPIRDCEPLR